ATAGDLALKGAVQREEIHATTLDADTDEIGQASDNLCDQQLQRHGTAEQKSDRHHEEQKPASEGGFSRRAPTPQVPDRAKDQQRKRDEGKARLQRPRRHEEKEKPEADRKKARPGRLLQRGGK